MSGSTQGHDTSTSDHDVSGAQDLTDITNDKSFLIDLTSQDGLDSNGHSSSGYSGGREDLLFSNLHSSYKSTPSNNDVKIDLSNDSKTLIDREKNDPPLDSFSISNIPEDFLNSGDQSDLDTEDSDFSFEKGSKLLNNSFDDNLPSTVTLLKTPSGSKVYVVGTAHFSEESQADVSLVIKSVCPHIVLVELCNQRVHIMQLDEQTILREAKTIDLQKIRMTIKENGIFNGLTYILLLNMAAHITKELGMAPGGEFRRALQEANNIPHCIVQLGDRPINVTMQRVISALSWWQTIKLVWHLLTSKEPIRKEDVERCKQRDLLKEILAGLSGEFPALEKVLVQERDIYLTHSLQVAANCRVATQEPIRVVGVVGIGHLQGIIDNWGKVSPRQIPPIMKIPPPTLSSRILRKSFKLVFIGVIAYTGYKLIPRKWLP